MSGAEEDDLKMLTTTLESHRGLINRREERTRACFEGDPAQDIRHLEKKTLHITTNTPASLVFKCKH